MKPLRYFLALRVYGDSLISLSLLARLPASVDDVVVLGTPITTEVAALMGWQRFPLQEVFPHTPGFFDIRAQGPMQAVTDLRIARAQIRRHVAAGNVVLVEHRDWRNRLVVHRGRLVEPPKTDSAYRDRATLLRHAFGHEVELPESARPARPVVSVVIHPDARHATREIPATIVSSLVDYLVGHGGAVTLIDPKARFAALRDRVRHYLATPRLDAAAATLDGADFFIGTDSFFMHLAHFRRIPSLILARSRAMYFAPPGLIAQGRCLPFAEARQRGPLETALARAMQPQGPVGSAAATCVS